MNSLNHSSPPTTFLCPSLPYKKQIDPETYFLEKQSDPSFEESHRLERLDYEFYEGGYYSLPCGACMSRIRNPTDFLCRKCTRPYHKECVKSPLEIKIPYHPKHPLHLNLFPSSNSTLHVGSSHYNNKCNCCGEDIEGIYYSCSICDFNLLPVCAISSNILSINYPKRHDHTLTYFPRVNSLTCDVCALGSDDKNFIYVCYQCDFLVHYTCVYLPNIIRISRHDHRLSFTLLPRPNKNLSCGVCRQRVDQNYGRYSCVKDCDYVVHSKCATRNDLCDGKELEGKPETEYEDIKPFKEISDGVIKHYGHRDHYMRLDKKENDQVEEGKRCPACILPICEGSFYNCTICDFFLHEVCAQLPVTKWHPLHEHPLTLQSYKNRGGEFFKCVACGYLCGGFSYTCFETSKCTFRIDARCALVSEPFTHELHPHPLFLTYEQGILRTCSMCGEKRKHLSCIECSFVFCFRCATLPYKVKYKYDEHYLVLSLYKEDTGGYNWCDICERETDPHVGFYTCNSSCSTTVHIECLLGVDPFMDHGQGFEFNQVWVDVIPNDGLSREICLGCQKRCRYRIAYQADYLEEGKLLLCSLECVYSVVDLP